LASGNTLLIFTPTSPSGPGGTTTAQMDWLVGTSTPAESVPVLAFDSATVEYADFHSVLPAAYAGGGLTLTFAHGANTATGGVAYEAAFRRIESDLDDLDTTAFTYDYNTVAIATLPSAVGEVIYSNLTFTNGADMDSLAAGEAFILRVRRATANATDTAAADSYIHRIIIKET
jgi:hypothetical protein